MPVPDRHQVALREAYTADLYGFGADYRRGDDFDRTLASIRAWAVAADGYDAASVDVFTGAGTVTLSGDAPPPSTVEAVHDVVVRHPRRRFHTVAAFPAAGGDDRPAPGDARPGAWAGATLLTPTGVVLGCLDLWSEHPRRHAAATHDLLPLLARAVMHVLEEQRRILGGRASVPPGPRPVVTRREDVGPGADPGPA